MARDIRNRMPRGGDRLLAFTAFPAWVAPTNTACERDLRPAMLAPKSTDGYGAVWSAIGEDTK